MKRGRGRPRDERKHHALQTQALVSQLCYDLNDCGVGDADIALQLGFGRTQIGRWRRGAVTPRQCVIDALQTMLNKERYRLEQERYAEVIQPSEHAYTETSQTEAA